MSVREVTDQFRVFSLTSRDCSVICAREVSRIPLDSTCSLRSIRVLRQSLVAINCVEGKEAERGRAWNKLLMTAKWC